MKTLRTIPAAAVGPVSDRTLLARVCTCGLCPARPVGDRSYSFTGNGYGPGRRFRLQGTLLGLFVVALLAGCGSGSGTGSSAHATGDGHGHGDEPTPAVVFKAGRGLQLSPAALQHIGLATTEVATRDLPGAAGVPAIPDSALLRTVRGDFVFVANGGWLLRTPVTIGAAGSGWLEVKDGLYEGDTVVAHGTRALWLAEIQAVNGGVSCSDGH